MDAAKLEPLMVDAGFVDVTLKKIKIEVGDWGPGIPPRGAFFVSW